MRTAKKPLTEEQGDELTHAFDMLCKAKPEILAMTNGEKSVVIATLAEALFDYQCDVQFA
jgi:hypothetical protein